jgi:hypothetical protein
VDGLGDVCLHDLRAKLRSTTRPTHGCQSHLHNPTHLYSLVRLVIAGRNDDWQHQWYPGRIVNLVGCVPDRFRRTGGHNSSSIFIGNVVTILVIVARREQHDGKMNRTELSVRRGDTGTGSHFSHVGAPKDGPSELMMCANIEHRMSGP